MQDLYQATGENVQLAVRDGWQALVLDKISGKRSVDTRTEVGGRLPLHATGVGKVILAYSEPELVRAVVADGLDRRTRHTIVIPGRLLAALAEVRRTSLGHALEEMTLGAASVAAPVLDGHGRLHAALAVVVRPRAGVHHLGSAVRTAALGLSRRLGEHTRRTDADPED
jgi:DNA-binding IclR family transcriptional regulator